MMPIYLELFLTYFKIGLFTFGGGYAMLPLIQSEVLRHGWLSMTELVNFVAVSESTPGPFAINMATFVGTQTAGILGAVSATLGVVLPSFIVILIVARIYDKFRTSRIVKGCMSGLKPAVVGLITAAVLSVAKTVFLPLDFANARIYISAFIAAASIFMAFKKVHPILIIACDAAMGLIVGFCGLI